MTQLTLAPLQRSCVSWARLEVSVANGFVENDDAALSQQVFEVTKAASEPMVEPHSVADDFRWRAMPFVAGCHAPIVAIHADRRLT